MNGDISRATVLVTGGTGFIGRHLVAALLQYGARVKVLSRRRSPGGVRAYATVVGDLSRPETLEGACRDVDIVFHLGGHAHADEQRDGKSEPLIRRINVDGTRALIERSLEAGVARFLFFSSVKAMGEGGEACLDETVDCRPVSAYGKAKRDAERLVLEAGGKGISATVLRLPMVYGPGGKGNLPRMIKAVEQGRFPPLPDTGNRRSMVDARDVVRAALLAAANPVAAGATYIVTDGQAYSTRQMYQWICEALQRPVPSWSIPLFLLRNAARVGDVVGRVSGRRAPLDSDALDKLIGSAWYSSGKISRELNYRPSITLKDALPDMVAEIKGGA